MTEWVEGEGEDGIFVCLEERCSGFRRVGIGQGVVIDGTCRISGDKE
jgi:hypothetical protein